MRIKEFSGRDINLDEFMSDLREKLSTSDIDNVKQDVLPYINEDQKPSLDIWSNDYFLQLADHIKILK